jgi:hypothetical protein
VPTTPKTKNSKPATGKKSTRGLLSRRGSTPSPRRRPALPGSNRPDGLVGRVQAALPGANRNTKQTGVQKAVAALGTATSNAASHKPSTKSMLGILAGGVGAAAIAGRRHNTEHEELREDRPAQPALASDASAPRISNSTADTTATTGGDHGDPQGPDTAAAA